MGFTNTVYNDTIKSFVDTNKQIIKNPLTLFIDKKPTIVKYYNKDTNISTLDEVTAIEYAPIGKNSPTKFNIILDALIYGIDKIQLNWNMDDTGIVADDITGDAYILPNTFIPYPGDYFIIPYLKETVIFKVNEVQTDTLDNGANYYKISYILDRTGKSELDKLNENIHDTYRMIAGTVGTNFKTIIRNTDYEKLEKIEITSKSLKEYYKQLFFDNYTQTFTFLKDDMYHFYDPFLIEFIKRNNIMSGTDKYTYVDQALSLWATFGIDYDKTFYRALELRDPEKANNCYIVAVATGVDDMSSLLCSRMDEYYCVDYNLSKSSYLKRFEVYPNDLINAIVYGSKLDSNKYPAFYQFIIKYFKNDWSIELDDFEMIDNIMMRTSEELFYGMPILIYILDRKANDMMDSKNSLS